MKAKDSVLNEHAQRFVREILAEELTKAGFVSRRGKDIHWCRLVNGEVFQSIVFYTRDPYLPMFLDIGYCFHPLFIVPELPANVRIPSMMRSIEALHRGVPILKRTTNSVYSESIGVICPLDDYHGLDILQIVISKLNEIKTVEDCYNKHMQRLYDCAEYYEETPFETILMNNLSVELMDEMVFFGDQRWYDLCRERINTRLSFYQKSQAVRKLWNVEKYDLNALLHLKEAIIEGKREQHLEYLHKLQEENIQLLKKKGLSGIFG